MNVYLSWAESFFCFWKWKDAVTSWCFFIFHSSRPLNELLDKRYFMEIPYDVCKRRRRYSFYCAFSSHFAVYVWASYIFVAVCVAVWLIDSLRVYTPPDPPGYFDGHVWPMYLKNRQEMESIASKIGERPPQNPLCLLYCMYVPVLHEDIDASFVE